VQHSLINLKKDIIICGSKSYKNINLDNLVDQFGYIIRHNMLMHDQGYGKRHSSQQVLNAHVNNNLRMAEREFTDEYSNPSTISKKQLCEFYNFFKTNLSKTVYYNKNNTKLMMSLLDYFGINIRINKQIRVGMGSLAQLVNERKKPYMIGFSLSSNQFLTHAYNKRGMEYNKECHDLNCEIKIIKALHERKLIDASLCAINDEGNLEADLGIKPTDTCRKIVETSNII